MGLPSPTPLLLPHFQWDKTGLLPSPGAHKTEPYNLLLGRDQVSKNTLGGTPVLVTTTSFTEV